MERWTMAQLKETDDLSFAIQILYERRKGLNPYAPLYQKITEAVGTLNMIREEKNRFIAKIAKGKPPEPEETAPYEEDAPFRECPYEDDGSEKWVHCRSHATCEECIREKEDEDHETGTGN